VSFCHLLDVHLSHVVVLLHVLVPSCVEFTELHVVSELVQQQWRETVSGDRGQQAKNKPAHLVVQ
jgi:hypothetical protein